jgi:hypothetical protein
MSKVNRFSISVSGKTADRLRSAVPKGDRAMFVDGILLSALDDETIRDRIVKKCHEA